jgi:hypothetical protein
MTFVLSFLLLHCSALADVSVAKKKFVDELRSGLPKTFCAEKSYFRQCFEGSEDKCLKTATAATTSCLSELEKDIPAILQQPSEGGTWGERLGTCAGQKFETDVAKSKKSNPDCNDPAKWKP